MKEKIKNYVLNEITKANEDFEAMCNNDIFEDNRLIEIFEKLRILKKSCPLKGR